MQILVTGGTGLIGRALCRALSADGHQITVLSRKPETVAAKCGEHVQAIATLDEWHAERRFDAVINLAGEPIADKAWSEARKRVLRDSRVALTERLVARIADARHKPAVLLSGSAVGYYGACGDTEVDETAPAGADFPAQLCLAWEQAAERASASGVRVCLLRTALVLSRDGGLLARMLPPFRFGLGARLGDGRQWMSWVHINDYVAMVLALLRSSDVQGAYNMAAPYPVTNADFTATLARVLGRPAVAAAPPGMLRLALGERAGMLLEGQRLVSLKIEKLGYRFQYSVLENALRDLLERRPL
ncbi:MAG: TIGR01777 family oxidoreductase [Gallionella sp.]|nr:TIGR01777 family oxidoreductase [Gallionella sp.]